MGKRSIPAPDPRIGEAAAKQIELAEKEYADYRTYDAPWLRSIVEESLGISRDNARRSQSLADYQLESMRRADDRYWSVAVPFENQLLQDINRFDSDAYKESLVGQALADVQAQFDNAIAQQQRRLERMGINPASGRAQALGHQAAIAQAAAMAAAANKVRQAADQIGLSTKMQMYGGMRGLAGLGATSAQLGLGAMGAGQAAASGMTSSAGSYLGANNAAFNTMNNGINAGITGLANYSLLQQNAAKLNNSANPLGALLGAGTHLGAIWLARGSDRRLKTDIVLVGKDERTGLNIYEFRYINGSKRYRGVMADEVEVLYPEAVFTRPDGYKVVDYALLGLEMVQVEGEVA